MKNKKSQLDIFLQERIEEKRVKTQFGFKLASGASVS